MRSRLRCVRRLGVLAKVHPVTWGWVAAYRVVDRDEDWGHGKERAEEKWGDDNEDDGESLHMIASPHARDGWYSAWGRTVVLIGRPRGSCDAAEDRPLVVDHKGEQVAVGQKGGSARPQLQLPYRVRIRVSGGCILIFSSSCRGGTSCWR